MRGAKWKKLADVLADRMQHHAFQCPDHGNIDRVVEENKATCAFCADTAAFQLCCRTVLPPYFSPKRTDA